MCRSCVDAGASVASASEFGDESSDPRADDGTELTTPTGGDGEEIEEVNAAQTVQDSGMGSVAEPCSATDANDQPLDAELLLQ